MIIVDSWKLVDNEASVAKLFRRMLACGGKMDSGLVREYFTDMDGTSYYTNLTAPISRGNHLGLVFRKNGRYHYIRDEVLEYLG